MKAPSLQSRIANIAETVIVAAIGFCCVAELLYNIGRLIGNILAPIL